MNKQQQQARAARRPGKKRRPVIDNGRGKNWDADGLTCRQREFVEALLGPAAGNASAAVRMAGYSQKNKGIVSVMAHQLLNLPNVQEAIGRALAQRRATPEWAKDRLIQLCQSSMANFLSVGKKGASYVDMEKAAEAGALGQLKEYKEEETVSGGRKVIKRFVKIHDPAPPLQNLLKIHGLLTPEEDRNKLVQQIRIRRVVLDGPKTEVVVDSGPAEPEKKV